MNTLFGIFIIISIILTFGKSPSLFLSSASVAGGKAVTLSLGLAGIYVFWMGIVRILEKTPAMAKLEQFVSPVVSRIFPSETPEIRRLITMNVAVNMLGAGGGATPLGISAIAKMNENAQNIAVQNGKKFDTKKATKSMLMLFILNATSLQIIPTTIISLRESAGSSAPASILLPTLLSSVIATVLGVFLVWIAE
ncbi:MAG: nucleoside recognition domain-containing protein [Bacillota bacterium]